MYYVGFCFVVEVQFQCVDGNGFFGVGFFGDGGYVVVEINFQFMNDSKIIDGELC